MQLVLPRKIDAASIHHVKSTRLNRHEIQDLDLVHLAIADVDERRNCAAQVEHRVHLHSGFPLTSTAEVLL